jgi:hypothetical protein
MDIYSVDYDIITEEQTKTLFNFNKQFLLEFSHKIIAFFTSCLLFYWNNMHTINSCILVVICNDISYKLNELIKTYNIISKKINNVEKFINTYKKTTET